MDSKVRVGGTSEDVGVRPPRTSGAGVEGGTHERSYSPFSCVCCVAARAIVERVRAIVIGFERSECGCGLVF